MKEPKKTSNPSIGISLTPAKMGAGFPVWLVERIREDYSDETYPDAPPKSYSEMRLFDELKRSIRNPWWSLVDHVVRSLDPGDFNSHA
jgi:hypothetical protein